MGWERNVVLDGIENLLADTSQAGLQELRQYLPTLLSDQGDSGRIVEVSKLLRSRVFRVRVELPTRERSFVIKRLSPQLSHRERRLVERWLPPMGLDGCGPPLLGAVAERSGCCVWHVYEDLGAWTLDQHLDNDDFVFAATQKIARVHMQSVLSVQFPEFRATGGEFGVRFYEFG